jgi:queuosine precursor transporter
MKRTNNNPGVVTLPASSEKLDLLVAIYIGALVAAELMGGKIFSVFGIVNASVAIFAFPITFTINDIVTEVYGKKRAVGILRNGLYVLIMLFVFSLLATSLPAAGRFVADNPAYLAVFQKSQRIILASLTAFWLSERLDIFVFSKIRQALGSKKLWLRNNASNFVGQLLDTTLFMLLAFYVPGNLGFIVSLIWPYWALKCVASVVETPFAYWGVKWLRK